jgi:predicted RNA-binding Zn-ribbon protein involved in translation (DUF1610 family)
MLAEPYADCRACGTTLEETTMYRRHAYCPDCPDADASDSLRV